jgi:hypothetical protein
MTRLWSAEIEAAIELDPQTLLDGAKLKSLDAI